LQHYAAEKEEHMTKQLPFPSPYLVLGTNKNGKPLVLTEPGLSYHKLLIGASGSGKSMYILWILLSLLRQGIRFMCLDLHGDLARGLIGYLLEEDFFSDPRFINRLHYYQFNRPDRALPFNILNNPEYDTHTIAVNLLDVIKRLFPSSSSTPAMDNVFLSAIHTLIEHKRNFIDIGRLLLDSSWRRSLTHSVSEQLVIDFFKNFDTKAGQTFDSALRRVFNLSYPLALQRSLGQSENRLRWRYVLDQTNVSCMFNLSGLDEYSQRFLGALIFNGLEVAYKARSDISPDKRIPVWTVADEFPRFAQTSEVSFSNILDETRKYKGTLILACQSFGHLSSGMTTSLQNAQTILLKLGWSDAAFASQHFFKKVTPQQQSMWDILFNGWQEETSPFEGVENTQAARDVFESIPRAYAIARIGPDPQLIKLPTLPQFTASEAKIKAIEDYYAKALLVPVNTGGSAPAPAPAPHAPGKAKRRISP